MPKKSNFLNNKNLKEEVYKYLKKNKNFLIENSELLNILEFPSNWKTKSNVIDFNYQQSKKLQKQNKLLKSIIKEILKTEHDNFSTQNKILKISLQVTEAKNFNEIINTIKKNCNFLLDVEFVNMFSNNKNVIKKNTQKIISSIDNRYLKKIFQNNEFLYLDNNPDFKSICFSSKAKFIKSFILLKLTISKGNYFLICLGSKNKKKFTKQQGFELINFFVKVCEGKIKNILKNN